MVPRLGLSACSAVQRGAACCSPPLCAAWEDKPGFGVIQNINMSQAAAWDNIAMVNCSNGTWKWYFLETCCTFPCLCLLENFYTEQTKHWSEQSLRLQLQRCVARVTSVLVCLSVFLSFKLVSNLMDCLCFYGYQSFSGIPQFHSFGSFGKNHKITRHQSFLFYAESK